jgi:PhoH-like ATPase
MGIRKALVVDTSVLLYDKCSIHSFPGNDVIIPLVVLDELDKFKDKPGLLGEGARYVNRFLDSLRARGCLNNPVDIGIADQSIRVLTEITDSHIPPGLDHKRNDNKIVGAAIWLSAQKNSGPVRVITKDINLRVKCDALEIEAQDYYRDYIDVTKSEKHVGYIELDVTDDEVDEFYSNDIDIESLSFEPDTRLYPNAFIVGKSPGNKSFLGVHKHGKISELHHGKQLKNVDVVPRNKEQRFALEALCDPNIPLVTLTGIAGSGKTFLTLMSALESIFSSNNKDSDKRIIVTRSIQPVGRDIGFLPGDLEDKMSPWMLPLIDNFRHHFKDLTYFETLRQKGIIEIAPLSFIRGRTFNDAIVIVDEAQNASIHELKTVITRIGKNSKVVLLGDTDQIDTPYIDKRSNGLSIVVEKFQSSPLSAHVHLDKGERSDLATQASRLL